MKFWCLAFAAGLVPLAAPAQGQQVAAAVQESAVERCTAPAASAPRSVVTACNEALASGDLGGRALAVAYFERGEALSALGQTAPSNADLVKSIDLVSALMDPAAPDPALYYLRGAAFHALGQVDKALADYDISARLNPRNEAVFLNRGIVLADYKRDFFLATIDFDRAIVLVPDDPLPHLLRGLIELRQNLNDRARADYESALAHGGDRAGNAAQALYGHGLALVRLGDSTKGLAEQASARALDPNVASSFSRYGLQ